MALFRVSSNKLVESHQVRKIIKFLMSNFLQHFPTFFSLFLIGKISKIEFINSCDNVKRLECKFNRFFSFYSTIFYVSLW